jgi:site-specific DNA recombinase
MIAAIYARRSNDQRDRDDADKSVAHQVRRARDYIESKGWSLDEHSLFVDDGISGAEFSKRPGLVRLLRALEPKPRPPFDVLVLMDESRIGRETIETAFVLKQIVQAGVRVFFYLDDRERTLDTPMEKVMLSLTAFGDELKRAKDSQLAYDKAAEKARHGHVVGSTVFGYDNVPVVGPSGKRSHVARRVNAEQAAIVRRIFDLSAKGTGYTRIAKLLNAEHAPAPKPKAGRPSGWSPSTVKVVLERRLYLGEVVWSRTKKRDAWGRKALRHRPEADWIRTTDKSLRIVSDPEWAAAHNRLDGVRTRLRETGGGIGNRRSRDIDSAYLLSGFARCGTCGGSLAVVGGSRSSARRHVYGCIAHHKKGTCSNGLRIPVDRVDHAVLTALAGEVLRPAVVMAVVDRVFEQLTPQAAGRDAANLRTDLQAVEREIGNLTRAIAAGGEMESLLTALRASEQRREEVRAALASRERTPVHGIDRAAIEAHVRLRLDDWRGLLSQRPAQGRQLLREVLAGPMTFTPGAGRTYRFTGEASFGGLLAGEASGSTLVVPVRGFEPRSRG